MQPSLVLQKPSAEREIPKGLRASSAVFPRSTDRDPPQYAAQPVGTNGAQNPPTFQTPYQLVSRYIGVAGISQCLHRKVHG